MEQIQRSYDSHEFDLSGSRDVIGHVTISFLVGHFLLMVLWNQAFISNGGQPEGWA